MSCRMLSDSRPQQCSRPPVKAPQGLGHGRPGPKQSFCIVVTKRLCPGLQSDVPIHASLPGHLIPFRAFKSVFPASWAMVISTALLAFWKAYMIPD